MADFTGGTFFVPGALRTHFWPSFSVLTKSLGSKALENTCLLAVWTISTKPLTDLLGDVNLPKNAVKLFLDIYNNVFIDPE